MFNQIYIYNVTLSPIRISVDCVHTHFVFLCRVLFTNFVNLDKIYCKLNKIVVLPLHVAGENIISYLVQPTEILESFLFQFSNPHTHNTTQDQSSV